MTLRIIAAIALLSSFWLSTLVRAENLELVRQLQATQQCRGCNLRGSHLRGTHQEEANQSPADLSNPKSTSLVGELLPRNLISLGRGTPSTQEGERVHSKRIIYNPPLFDPPDEGPRPTTAGGGTRGGDSSSCLKNGKSIIPLTPKNHFGLTVSQYPTFFLYIPESTAQEVLLVLREPDTENVVYNTAIDIPSQPGVVRLSLPANTAPPPLEEGKTYHWYLSLVCGTKDTTKNGKADGWIKRIEPSTTLKHDLQRASLPNRPRVYGKAGIWQETLTTLAELRDASPNDLALASDWEDLLKSVGLDAVAKEPLISEQEMSNRQGSEGARAKSEDSQTSGGSH